MKEANLGNLLIQHLMNSPFGIRAVHRAVLDGRMTGHHMRLKFSSFFVAQMWRPGSSHPSSRWDWGDSLGEFERWHEALRWMSLTGWCFPKLLHFQFFLKHNFLKIWKETTFWTIFSQNEGYHFVVWNIFSLRKKNQAITGGMAAQLGS